MYPLSRLEYFKFQRLSLLARLLPGTHLPGRDKATVSLECFTVSWFRFSPPPPLKIVGFDFWFYVCGCTGRWKMALDSPGSGVTGSWEVDVSVRNWTLVLWKSGRLVAEPSLQLSIFNFHCLWFTSCIVLLRFLSCSLRFTCSRDRLSAVR